MKNNQQNIQKVAIVTGASKGIGLAIAMSLVDDGYSVVINYNSSENLAKEVVENIHKQGGNAIAIKANVAVEKDVEMLFEKTLEVFGGVDVVVSNAGKMMNAPIKTKNIVEFDQTIETNLRGSFLVMAKAAECLKSGGRIIALSSSVIPKAMPGYGAYIASKAGVEGLVHVLANELRGKDITVNAIAPGPVATELFLKDKSDQQIDAIAKMAPLERLGQPEDISEVIRFLVSEKGSWINSQVLRVNGGFS